MTPQEDPESSGTPQAPARGLSILGELKSRRQEIVEGNHLDLAVPRWENPEIWVRYEPVDAALLERASRGYRKAKDKSAALVNSNADALIKGCVGVYAKLPDDDTKYSLRADDPNGEWTTFDPDLAANLGMDDPEHQTARAVVKELFLTDGDIIGHARRLGEWSGFTMGEADDELLGE